MSRVESVTRRRPIAGRVRRSGPLRVYPHPHDLRSSWPRGEAPPLIAAVSVPGASHRHVRQGGIQASREVGR